MEHAKEGIYFFKLPYKIIFKYINIKSNTELLQLKVLNKNKSIFTF